MTYMVAGDIPKALATYADLEQALGPNAAFTQYVNILLLDAQGEKDKIGILMDEMLAQRMTGQDPSPIVIAAAYSRLGDDTRAIDWFRRAVAQRSPFAMIVVGIFERELTLIDENPLYQALLKRMNLPLQVDELAREATGQ
jgi:tetratricopeptide (TPR) repeat protein